jgi:hypothetical protein
MGSGMNISHARVDGIKAMLRDLQNVQVRLFRVDESTL